MIQKFSNVLILSLFVNISFCQYTAQLKVFQKNADSIVCLNCDLGELSIKFNRKFSDAQRTSTIVTENKIFNTYNYIYFYEFYLGRKKIHTIRISFDEFGNLINKSETLEKLNAIWEASKLHYFSGQNNIYEHISSLGLDANNFSISVRYKNKELYWILCPKVISKLNFGYQIKIGDDRTVSFLQPSEIIDAFGL